MSGFDALVSGNNIAHEPKLNEGLVRSGEWHARAFLVLMESERELYLFDLSRSRTAKVVSTFAESALEPQEIDEAPQRLAELLALLGFEFAQQRLFKLRPVIG